MTISVEVVVAVGVVVPACGDGDGLVVVSASAPIVVTAIGAVADPVVGPGREPPRIVKVGLAFPLSPNTMG